MDSVNGLQSIFLPTSRVDGETRCHCGGALVVTVSDQAGFLTHWGKCSLCGDGGALQITSTTRVRLGSVEGYEP